MTYSTREGVHGETGALSGHDLLKALEALGCSGTLVLEQEGGAAILLLQNGQVEAHHALGAVPELGSAHLHFHFEPHAASATPQLSSRFPRSAASLLRAVPAFGFNSLPSLLDLQTLLAHLRQERFSGCLALETPSSCGVLLLAGGRVGAAIFEEDGLLREKNEALRALRREHVGQPEAELRLRRLDAFFVQSLLGMAAGNKVKADDPFSGLEVGERGYLYVREDQPVLRVAAELRGPSARYAPLLEPADLKLPDEPPGWEEQRFQLTLRGRDALNPMTEVAVEFQRSFGRLGRRLLEHLDKGLTLEGVAQVLTVELSDLKPWLGKLEEEGLVRALKD